MTSAFGAFQVRIDSWEVDYGDQTPLEIGEEQVVEQVDHEVELPEGSWRPIAPAMAALQGRVLFVDGVRRLEARIQVRQGEHLIYGGFGSLAVGAVAVESGKASFVDVRVERIVPLGAGYLLPKPVAIHEHLTYKPESTAAVEPEAPLQHIQKSMRLAEATLARDLSRDDTLSIVDGPLSFEPERRGVALGYVKRIHRLYLPPKFLPFLSALPSGNRTPIFSIRSERSGFPRYSWFQRLATPSPGATELHGIVRLEVAEDVGIEKAKRLADTATTWLPRTVPTRARDPRSPQNLLPIGALEQRLRVALGDARLFRRWIETFVAKEASNG